MGIEIRSAKNMQEVKSAYTLAARMFGPNYRESKQRKAHILKTDNVQCPADVVVALAQEKIAGMVRIVERKNYFLGSLLRSGGLTSVCVMPGYRGKGVGSALINTALARIRQRGFSLSTVIARRAADGFYPQYGYVGTGIFTEVIITRDTCNDIASQYRFNFKTGFKNAFFKKYAQMHTRSYRNLPVAFYRSLEWWNNIRQNAKYKIKNDEFVNVIYKDSLIGYFIYHDNKVIEAAYFPKTGDVFCKAILQYLDSRLKKGVSEILIALPEEHMCFKYYKMLNHTMKARMVWDGGHLIRIMDKEKIKKIILKYIDKYCPEFNMVERAKAKDRIRINFDNCDSKIHNQARRLMLGIMREDNSPVIKKIAKKMQHSWPILDEF